MEEQYHYYMSSCCKCLNETSWMGGINATMSTAQYLITDFQNQKKILTVNFQNLRWKIQNMIVIIKRNISQCTEHQQRAQQFKFCVSRKGMILLKWEDRFFPGREDLHLLEVTAEVSLWYGLFFDFLSWKLYVCFFKNKSIISKGTLLFWSHNLKDYFEFWNFHANLCVVKVAVVRVTQ